MSPPTADPVVRFYRHVVAGPNGCHIWTAFLYTGYGRFRNPTRGGSNQAAHRWIYERLVGPVPSGMHLDHLCRVRRCVNPLHMEPVTPRENMLRGIGPGSVNARKTACLNGHPFEGANLIVYASGQRVCRECRRQRDRERRRLLREATDTYRREATP